MEIEIIEAIEQNQQSLFFGSMEGADALNRADELSELAFGMLIA